MSASPSTEGMGVGERWEKGIPHDPRSVALYKSIEALDFEQGDYFGFKSGGDGDNGEHLMYLLDMHFARSPAGASGGPSVDVASLNLKLCAEEGHVLGVVARPCLRCHEWFDPQYGRAPEPSESRTTSLLLSQAARLLREYADDAHEEDVPDVLRWLAVYEGRSPEPGGDLATVKRLFAAECDDIDRLLERLGLGDKATIAERYRSEGGFLRGGKIENAIRERMSCLGWLIEWRGAPDKKARWATVTKDGSERVIFDDKAGDALRFARADDAYACMMMLWQAQWRGSENAPRLEELSVSEHLWCNGPSPETKDDKP